MNIAGSLKRFASPMLGGKPLVVTVVIIIALTVGLTAKIFTNKNDSVIEEIAEKVLSEYGINYDFSPDDEGDATPKT